MILKRKHKLLLASLATIVGTSSLVTLVNANTNIEKNDIKQEVLFYEIDDSHYNDHITNSENYKSKSLKQRPVRRFDIFFWNNKKFSLNEYWTIIKNQYLKDIKEEFVFELLEHINVISIAILKKENAQLFKEAINKFSKQTTDVKSIFFFNTNLSYNAFKDQRTGPRKSRYDVRPQQNLYNFMTAREYNGYNEANYNVVGLDYDTRGKHLDEYLKKSPVTIGLLEAKGVVRHDSAPFKWNNRFGNGVHWRDEPFYHEVSSDHADKVGEILVGIRGINQTAKLWSVQLDMFWNGYAGEINFFLSKNVNIINNSWSKEDERGYANYDYNAEYFDNIINSNPELINIKSAGNQFDGDFKDNGEYIPPYKYIAASSLSKNSIVVGAINTNQDQNKTTYSQISGNGNYVSVVAPGNSYAFTSDNKYLHSGTSFSAPVISALASMILQRNKNQFDRGHDSIIMKSALISGSKKPNYTNRVYTEETGFGIPQFLDVDQAVKKFILFCSIKKSKQWLKQT